MKLYLSGFSWGASNVIFHQLAALAVVLSLDKWAYPENPHVLCCYIKLAFHLTV